MPGFGLLTGFPVRIEGIDAPEIHGKCPEEIALAAKAKARLKVLVTGGVTFLTDFRTDNYGRLLARPLDRKGQDIGQILVSEGLARAYDGKTARKPWCAVVPAAAP